jgi:SAM-dependent methyltransferase
MDAKIEKDVATRRNAAARFFLQREYAFGYLLFSMSSNEEEVIGNSIRKALPSAVKHSSCLDIGAADGRISRLYAKDMNVYEAFEPNPLLFSLLKSRFDSRANVRLRNLCFSPQSVTKIKKFDVVVCCHVFYHINPADWERTIAKIGRLLRKGGSFINVLWSVSSDVRMVAEKVTPNRWICVAEDFLSDNKAWFEQCRLRLKSREHLRPEIQAHSREAAAEIADFLVGRRYKHFYPRRKSYEALTWALLHGIGNTTEMQVYEKL